MQLHSQNTVVNTRVQIGTLPNPSSWSFLLIRLQGLQPIKRYILVFILIFVPTLYTGIKSITLTQIILKHHAAEQRLDAINR